MKNKSEILSIIIEMIDRMDYVPFTFVFHSAQTILQFYQNNSYTGHCGHIFQNYLELIIKVEMV